MKSFWQLAASGPARPPISVDVRHWIVLESPFDIAQVNP
jgi:hypothetical protein